nr:MAG TPA: hypothetical protein [Caudoviricetes sp.]
MVPPHHSAGLSQFPLTFRLLCLPSVHFLRMWVVCWQLAFLETKRPFVLLQYWCMSSHFLRFQQELWRYVFARLQQIVPVCDCLLAVFVVVTLVPYATLE